MDGELILAVDSEGEHTHAATTAGAEEAQGSGSAPTDASNTVREGFTTVWGTAFEQWREVRLKEQLTTKWDEAFGQIVNHKEATGNEKHRLVTTVKQFAASYKQEATAEKVEQLLRFFKPFIAALFERIELSEKHFIAMYQSISMAPDPAPLLFAAHVEVSNLVERIRQLQVDGANKAQQLAALQKTQATAMRDIMAMTREGSAVAGDEGNASTASSSIAAVVAEMKELRAQMEDLRSEKRALVAMVRDGETQLAASKDEVARLSDARRLLSHHLLQAQTRYEDFVAQSERDTNALMDELSDSHQRLQLDRGGAAAGSVGSGATSGVVAALEAEVDSLRRALSEAQRNQLLLESANAEAQRIGPSSDVQATQDSSVASKLTQHLHEALAESARSRDALMASLAAEKRARREADGRVHDLERELKNADGRVNGLHRTIEELRRYRPVSGGGGGATAEPEAQPQQATVRSNDELLADMLQDLGGGAAATSAPSPGPAGAQETSRRATATAAKVAGVSEADLGDPTFIASIVKQRDQLRTKVSEYEKHMSLLEQELARCRDQLSTGGSPPSPSAMLTSAFGDGRYSASVLASIPKYSGTPSGGGSRDLHSVPSGVGSMGVAIDVGGDGDAVGGPKRRRKQIQQTVRRAADSVAVVIANMVVHSATTRLALVLYLVGLHLVVMLTTYAMAFRGGSSACRGALRSVS